MHRMMFKICVGDDLVQLIMHAYLMTIFIRPYKYFKVAGIFGNVIMMIIITFPLQ